MAGNGWTDGTGRKDGLKEGRVVVMATADAATTRFTLPRPISDAEASKTAKAMAGVADEDSAFFAYADLCAELGVDMVDGEPRTEALANVGYRNDLDTFEGQTVFVNASVKNVAVESTGADGLKEWRVVPPGGTLTLEAGVVVAATAGGKAADADPIAKEDDDGREDGYVTVIRPFSYVAAWDFGAAGIMKAKEVALAKIRVAKADESNFAEAYRIHPYGAERPTKWDETVWTKAMSLS